MTRGYSENADGDVILTMSREDYDELRSELNYAALRYPYGPMRLNLFALTNRLNQGNPHYTPYKFEQHKVSAGKPANSR